MTLDETFKLMARGGSLSRLGDGELRLLAGKGGGWEDPRSEGGREARKGLEFCARLGGSPGEWPPVCIGTMPLLDGKMDRYREGARREFWSRFRSFWVSSWAHIMAPGTYCDTTVSRPDALDPNVWPAVEYFTPRWKSVFQGKRILVVSGVADDGRPTTHDRTVFDRHLDSASHVEKMRSFTNSSGHHFPIQQVGMFRHYVNLRNSIMDEVERLKIDTIVASLGPTATVLAAELGCRGYHVLDVGQFGGNFTKAESTKGKAKPAPGVNSTLVRADKYRY